MKLIVSTINVYYYHCYYYYYDNRIPLGAYQTVNYFDIHLFHFFLVSLTHSLFLYLPRRNLFRGAVSSTMNYTRNDTVSVHRFNSLVIGARRHGYGMCYAGAYYNYIIIVCVVSINRHVRCVASGEKSCPMSTMHARYVSPFIWLPAIVRMLPFNRIRSWTTIISFFFFFLFLLLFFRSSLVCASFIECRTNQVVRESGQKHTQNRKQIAYTKRE